MSAIVLDTLPASPKLSHAIFDIFPGLSSRVLLRNAFKNSIRNSSENLFRYFSDKFVKISSDSFLGTSPKVYFLTSLAIYFKIPAPNLEGMPIEISLEISTFHPRILLVISPSLREFI